MIEIDSREKKAVPCGQKNFLAEMVVVLINGISFFS
jgi:hypothetical protein